MKPIIGVVSHIDLNRFGMPATSIPLTYTSSIEKAGGVPVILSFTKDNNILTAMANHVQGFLFPGGNDIDPVLYNEPPSALLRDVNKPLDQFQMAVLDLVLEKKKPVLAICRGIQIANVVLGGTLFQDIDSQFDTPVLKHMQDTISFDTDHAVDFEPGSRLHDMFGPNIMINSRHHQSIKKLGKDLIITARAPDGVIEAAQHKTLPLDLVQWHPELMMQKNDDMLPLFNSFVERCKIK